MSPGTQQDAAGAVRRALALLGAASADWRQRGPSDGSTPLYWPIAVSAARAQLTHALTCMPCLDCRSTDPGHATPCDGRRTEPGPYRTAMQAG